MSPFALAIIGPVAAAAAAAIFGYPLARYWQERQKRREIALATMGQFYTIYGEFVRIWKAWNNSLLPLPGEGAIDPEKLRGLRADSLAQITRAEADLESIILKVACERKLAIHEAEALAKYRQGYHQLATAIKNYQRLAWDSREHPEYIVYKEAAVAFACILSMLEKIGRPSPKEMMNSMSSITAEHWRHASVWCTRLTKLPRGVSKSLDYDSDKVWLRLVPSAATQSPESLPDADHI